jgi:hypothetical protein
MIKLNTPYTIENGKDQVSFTEGKKGSINGTYGDGTLSGTLEGNVLNATFHNKKANASGLMEITFTENGFTAKWKNGLEPGPMRGKWEGKLNAENSSEKEKINETQEVELKLSGRIPKYFFGKLKEKYKNEISEIIKCCHEDIKTEQNLLEKFLELTHTFNLGEFFNCVISEENLAKFPNFKDAYETISNENANHYRLIEIMFESDYQFGEMVFFESDAHIEVLINGDTKWEGSLEEFNTIESSGNMEENAEDNDAEEIRQLAAANVNFDMYTDYCDWNRNKLGCLFLCINIKPEELKKLSESKNEVMLFLDEINEYCFYLGEIENFKMNKLTFASHEYAHQFRITEKKLHDSCVPIFNYVFYDKECIKPDQNITEDMGARLYYNNSWLDFLMNG